MTITNRYFALFFIAVFLLGKPLFSADSLRFGSAQSGSLEMSDQALGAEDRVLFVLSESVFLDPAYRHITPFDLPLSQAEPVAGCLSVAQVHLRSGEATLKQDATLTFRCPAVPAQAEVYGWMGGTWQKIPAVNRTGNSIQVKIRALTTYAVFPAEQDAQPISQI